MADAFNRIIFGQDAGIDDQQLKVFKDLAVNVSDHVKNALQEVNDRTIMLRNYFFTTAIKKLSNEFVATGFANMEFFHFVFSGLRFRINPPKIILGRGGKKIV